MTTKHQQFILAMDAAYFVERPADFPSSYSPLDSAVFVSQVVPRLVIKQRAPLEKDPTYRQLTPYLVFCRVEADGTRKYAAYRRGEGVGESRLHGDVSVGFGGHIDMADVAFDPVASTIDLPTTITSAAARELFEEVEFFDQAGQKLEWQPGVHLDEFVACILDDSNDVGQVHLGLVAVKQVKPDIHRVQTRETELETLGFFTAQELLASGWPLENWTRLFLQNELTA